MPLDIALIHGPQKTCRFVRKVDGPENTNMLSQVDSVICI